MLAGRGPTNERHEKLRNQEHYAAAALSEFAIRLAEFAGPTVRVEAGTF